MAGLGHQGDPRRVSARPGHRCRQRTDLCEFDVRAGRRRRPRGGFEYARTGNPTRAALEASLAAVEEAAFGPGVFLRAWPLPTVRCAHCCGRAITSSSPTTPMAARSGSSTRSSRSGASTSRRWAVRSRRGPCGDHPADPADLGGDAYQPAALHRRHRCDHATCRLRKHKGLGGQHLCLAGIAAAAPFFAPTSCCI